MPVCTIQTKFSPLYGSQSNGTSGRLNRKLRNMARTMLLDTEVREKLWGETISISNLLIDRLRSRRVKMDIPFTRWYNEAPDLLSLLVFGFKGYVFQYRSKTTGGKKFLTKNLVDIFVGIKSPTTFYRALIPTLQSIQICRRKISQSWREIHIYHRCTDWHRQFLSI